MTGTVTLDGVEYFPPSRDNPMGWSTSEGPVKDDDLHDKIGAEGSRLRAVERMDRLDQVRGLFEAMEKHERQATVDWLKAMHGLS